MQSDATESEVPSHDLEVDPNEDFQNGSIHWDFVLD
jgi:hypothetical protein